VGGNTLTSNAVSFTVGSNPPTITSLTPPTAYQGNPSVALTFTGTNIPSGSVIQYELPGSSTWITAGTPATTGCSGSPALCTGVTGTLDLIQSSPPGGPQPAGLWYVRVLLPGTAAAMPPWPLRVLSNQAILQSYTAAPAPTQSGKVGDTKTGFTFNVSNLQGWTTAGVPNLSGVQVAFFDPAFPNSIIQSLTPAPVPSAGATSFTTGGFSLSGLKAGVYAFTVDNPNATKSNPLTFTVTPGPPTLTSVCLKGTSCTSQVSLATLASPTINLALTGTNFAAPDQNGNGSTVWVAADFMTGYPAADPCNATTGGTSLQELTAANGATITVVSPTEMDVSFDTRNAIAGTTYYVEVYNPSGASVPLKSGCGVSVTSLPSFTINQ
jgi:hypothetical protein